MTLSPPIRTLASAYTSASLSLGHSSSDALASSSSVSSSSLSSWTCTTRVQRLVRRVPVTRAWVVCLPPPRPPEPALATPSCAGQPRLLPPFPCPAASSQAPTPCRALRCVAPGRRPRGWLRPSWRCCHRRRPGGGASQARAATRRARRPAPLRPWPRLQRPLWRPRASAPAAQTCVSARARCQV